MKTLLIIDDDPLIRKTLSSHLSGKGFEVLLAEDGEQGFQMFDKGLPDLVVLDIRLPDMDGLEVLRKIKAKASGALVIIMTAYDDMKTTIEAVKSGAFEYLVKPLDFVELDLTVDKAFQVKSLEEKLDALKELKQSILQKAFSGELATENSKLMDDEVA